VLFTTAAFALLYLPIVLLGFFAIGRRSPAAAALWLFAASVFFYGYWMPAFTLLLLGSIVVNFTVGLRLLAARRLNDGAAARRWLTAGVVFDLGVLGYFKYADFFIGNVNALLGTQWALTGVILPIGISFYSFTQIAYLVDTYQGKVKEPNAVHYGLFVTYFPHLVAGPVLHHAQMMPQFAQAETYRPDAGRLSAGLLIFAIGLSKKILLADGISPYADAVFDAAEQGLPITSGEAWLGAVAYSAQLYFDFSGYSDMAIGLSWMFNIRLPFNFDSPYKSTSIVEFWRRWHITLSNFLRDYLYIALGGNRKGPVRRYMNLAATMVLGGLWHGSSWSFVIWGALHGVYLMVNHGFRAVLGPAATARLDGHRLWSVLSWALTMLAVVVAWVFFRAHTFEGAVHVLGAMFYVSPPPAEASALWNAGLSPLRGLEWIVVLGALAVFAPNSNRIGTRLLAILAEAGDRRVLAATVGLCLAGALLLINGVRDSVSAFIYFNF
jgi:alginate O-acetyltransferase complex protein AlgI